MIYIEHPTTYTFSLKRIVDVPIYKNVGMTEKGGYISQQSREKARKRHKRIK